VVRKAIQKAGSGRYRAIQQAVRDLRRPRIHLNCWLESSQKEAIGYCKPATVHLPGLLEQLAALR